MSTQVIDFNNVENVVFNGNEVEALKLNDVVVWEGFKKLSQLIDKSIESVTAEDLEGVTKIGSYAFYDCLNLTSLTLPSSLISIGTSAFSNCLNLTSLALPSSLTSLSDSAFSYCDGLTSVVIPENVTSLGTSCFQHCYHLTTMRFLPTTPPTIGISSIPTGAIQRIEVPSASLSAYKDSYTDFKNIIVGV